MCVMSKPSKAVIRAWTRLLLAQRAALSEIETALKQAGLPPLTWYDVLLELGRVSEKGARPFELERELLLPQYGLSRLLDRIEAAGYLERRPLEEDGRGQIIVITRAGEAVRQRMWPIYAKAIESAVGVHLTTDEASVLGELLWKLYRRSGG